MCLSAPAAFALYYGPSVTVPVAISPGANINIDLATVASSTFVAPPSGSNPPCTSGLCAYPLQSCTNPSAFYVSIHEITVTDPNGNQYMLGSATTSGVYWPANQGGGGSNSGPAKGQAKELNITVTQSDTLTFGTGATGPSGASFASEDYHPVAPFTAVADTAGPYYWWTVAGNSYGSNLRLDQHSSITPTVTHGVYTLDVEGVAVCGKTTTAVKYIVFFDAPITVVTPEFGASIVAVAGAAFALMMLVRRSALGKRATALPTSN
jgi:hypothetical protein